MRFKRTFILMLMPLILHASALANDDQTAHTKPVFSDAYINWKKTELYYLENNYKITKSTLAEVKKNQFENMFSLETKTHILEIEEKLEEIKITIEQAKALFESLNVTTSSEVGTQSLDQEKTTAKTTFEKSEPLITTLKKMDLFLKSILATQSRYKTVIENVKKELQPSLAATTAYRANYIDIDGDAQNQLENEMGSIFDAFIKLNTEEEYPSAIPIEERFVERWNTLNNALANTPTEHIEQKKYLMHEILAIVFALEEKLREQKKTPSNLVSKNIFKEGLHYTFLLPIKLTFGVLSLPAMLFIGAKRIDVQEVFAKPQHLQNTPQINQNPLEKKIEEMFFLSAFAHLFNLYVLRSTTGSSYHDSLTNFVTSPSIIAAQTLTLFIAASIYSVKYYKALKLEEKKAAGVDALHQRIEDFRKNKLQQAYCRSLLSSNTAQDQTEAEAAENEAIEAEAAQQAGSKKRYFE